MKNVVFTLLTIVGMLTIVVAQPTTQQGNKLVGGGAVGAAAQGGSVSLSADGNTAIVGGSGDSSGVGAAWVYTQNSSGIWAQQGNKLVGGGAVGTARQGGSVSISSDGNTAIVGGENDNYGVGAVWVYTRTGGIWSQQGNKLVGSGAVGYAPHQGRSVSISSDGNTAIVGGANDNNGVGAAWIYTRNGNGIWSQQGNKLVGSGAVGNANQGNSVSISADGNTAIVGGYSDDSNKGAVWVYTRTGGIWSEQGGKILGGNYFLQPRHGCSVSLSANGNTAIVGGYGDNSNVGKAWVYTRIAGNWYSQAFGFLVGSGAVGTARQGWSVSISADGQTAIVGGYSDNSNVGATWVYKRTGGTWSQQGNKLVGSGAVGGAGQGASVSISANGNTAIVGGSGDNNGVGAAWIFSRGKLLSYGVLMPFTNCFGIPSSYQSFTISGQNLTSNVVITSPNGFEISRFPIGGYTSVITLNQSGGFLNDTLIYLRVSSSALAGNYLSNIVIASLGSDTIYLPITRTVNPSPIVGFTINSSTQCLNNNNFIFSDTTKISSGTFTNLWNFGSILMDTSSITVVNKAYTTPNNYNIKYIATSNNGCKDSIIKTIIVNPSPTAGFTINNLTQCLKGNSFIFNDTSSISNGTITRQWVFGDGNTATSNNPVKVYQYPSSYSVKLVVVSSSGCKDSVIKTIIVNPSPTAGSIAGQINNVQTAVPYLYNINQQSGVTYQWLVNNGAFVTGQGTNTITVQWINNGAGKLTVVITNSSGCTDTSSITVVISAQAGIISITPTSASTGTTVTINGTNLIGATAVKFGGVNAQSFNVVSSNQITAVVGSGATGDVTVITPNGTATLTGFTYLTNTGIQTVNLISGLSIYPNPASSEINVEADASLIGSVYIVYDNKGKSVLTGKISSENNVIELGNLSAGVYLFRVGENMKQTFKVIKE